MNNHDTSHINAHKRQQLLEFVKLLSPGADPASIRLGGLLHRVGHTLYQISESSLAESALSFAQYRLLMDLLFSEQIEGCGQLNPSHISERQGISRNTVSALIRNLEEEGLVRRHLDEEDRRRFLIELTDAGRERVHAHASRHFQIISNCFQALDQQDKETLSRLLHKLGEQPEFNLAGV